MQPRYWFWNLRSYRRTIVDNVHVSVQKIAYSFWLKWAINERQRESASRRVQCCVGLFDYGNYETCEQIHRTYALFFISHTLGSASSSKRLDIRMSGEEKKYRGPCLGTLFAIYNKHIEFRTRICFPAETKIYNFFFLSIFLLKQEFNPSRNKIPD